MYEQDPSALLGRKSNGGICQLAYVVGKRGRVIVAFIKVGIGWVWGRAGKELHKFLVDCGAKDGEESRVIINSIGFN